jgi:microcystin-dependent protein|tara:strand:+ start:3814 stop:4386 length:573 start_codon:yes stop_codon:yes gene_type:complete
MSNYEATKFNFDASNITGIEGINTGIIVPWSAASVPSGFLECDGSNVSRSTYSALFAVVGTTYGAGDGSSTFGLPDLQNNIPVGSSNNKAVGSTAGAENVTASGNVSITAAAENHSLSIAELAAHSHTVGGGRTLSTDNSGGPQIDSSSHGITGSGTAHGHNVTVNAASVTGDATSVLQPFLTTLYIIKT